MQTSANKKGPVPVIKEVVPEPSSLAEMCTRTKLRTRVHEKDYRAVENGFLVISACGYDVILLGVASRDELYRLGRSRPRRAKPKIPCPPLRKAKRVEHQESIGLWALKLSSSDAIVIRRTQTSDLAEKRKKF
eukprot:Gb_09845 [translate_table: standard]